MLPDVVSATASPSSPSPRRRIIKQALLCALFLVALAAAVYWLRRVVGPWSESMELISIIRSLIANQSHGVIIATGLVAAATILAAVLIPVATVTALVVFERRTHPNPEGKDEPEKKL